MKNSEERADLLGWKILPDGLGWIAMGSGGTIVRFRDDYGLQRWVDEQEREAKKEAES